MYLDNPQETNNKEKRGISIKDEILCKKTQQKYLGVVTAVASNWLTEKPEAASVLAYLNKRVDPQHHNIFKFGYFPNDLMSIYNFMDDIHEILPTIDPKIILEETGIVEFRKRKPKIFYYNNPLLIPFFDAYGNLISIVGRTILPEKEMKEKEVSKYKNLPFHRSQHLFGLNLSRFNMVRRGYGIIIEGQFDMISAFLAGMDNTAALCGSKIGMEHILLLKRYTKRLFFLLDNDEAGEKGWKAIQSKASKYGIIVKMIVLPKGYKDIDEFIKAGESMDVLTKQLL